MMRGVRIMVAACLTCAMWCAGGAAVPSIVKAEMLDQILAVVNDELITQRDFDEMFLPIQEQLTAQLSGEELEMRLAQARGEVLNSLIEDRLVLSEAKKMGITISDTEVEERLKDVKSQFESEKQYEMVMAAQGLTPARLRQVYRNQLMSKRAVDYRIYSRIVIPPSEVSTFYEAHRDEFRQPDQAHLSNILIRAGELEDREDTRRRADEIYQRLLQGASFTELAKEYSRGPGADRGGDLGVVSLANIRPELAVPIMQVDAGDMTPVIESDLGFHIFLVHEKTIGKELSLEEAQESIKRRLMQQQFVDRLQAWLAGLRKQAFIEIRASSAG